MLLKKAIFLKTYNKYSESFFAYKSKINLQDLYIFKSHLPFSGNMCIQKSKNLHLLMHTISQLNMSTRVSQIAISFQNMIFFQNKRYSMFCFLENYSFFNRKIHFKWFFIDLFRIIWYHLILIKNNRIWDTLM